jgi:hypothetical protein
MPLPTLSTVQIEWVVQQVAAYIGHQRETYRPGAVPLGLSQKNAMRPFFPEPVLDSTRLVVLSGQRVSNPPFYGQLVQMGFEAASLPDFAHMAAITFVDTVVSHEAFTDRLLFHELVHVVQYEKLGVAEFAVKYVRGFLSGGSYEAIPLEMNAYELDARLAGAPTKAFSVSDEVQKWIRADRF